MADEYDQPLESYDQQLDTEEYESEEQEGKKRLGSLITLLVVVIVIIFILLMLRDCGERASGKSSEKGKKSIEAVEGYKPIEGAVSVWIVGDSSIDDIVMLAGAEVSDYVDMGGGRYILDVNPGSEDIVIGALKDTKGCYDAGRVYEAP